MRCRSILAAFFVVALSGAALANGPHDTPKRHQRPATPRTTASADLAADADARADAASSASSEALATAAQKQLAHAASGGNVLSTSSDVLALDLPGHEAATAVTGCQVSRGSLGFLGAGSGGRIKFDAGCVAHVRCLETVATLERLGYPSAAAHALLACAGLGLPPDVLDRVAPAPAVSPSVPVYVTPEQLERAFRDSVRK